MRENSYSDVNRVIKHINNISYIKNIITALVTYGEHIVFGFLPQITKRRLLECNKAIIIKQGNNEGFDFT